jgi:adenylosuccinate synthase
MNDLLVERGHEFGTTTGRKRRCGWMDTVALRHAVRLNGITDLVLTKLDVMYEIDPMKVVTSYKTTDGQVIDYYPYQSEQLAGVTPLFHEIPGFSGDISTARSYNELPQEARGFIEFVGQSSGAPITLIGVGQSRDQIIPL